MPRALVLTPRAYRMKASWAFKKARRYVDRARERREYGTPELVASAVALARQLNKSGLWYRRMAAEMSDDDGNGPPPPQG